MYETGATLAIDTEIPAANAARRFERLLSDHSGPRPIFDQLILEVADCLVVPTLGSILPYWILIVPRQEVANFSTWKANTGNDPIHIVGEVLAKLGVKESTAIWFEHGATQIGSSVGCGVDHAHLHVLIDSPFSFVQFAQEIRNLSALSWTELSAHEAYDHLTGNASYLLTGFCGSVLSAERVESVGSQFFRRVVAKLIGKPDAWNYRTHAHLNNVAQTLLRFGRFKAQISL